MTKQPAGTQSALREANAAKIVETVKRFGGLTQVEVAEATGLSTATVSAIVKDLAAAGVVDTSLTSRSGRRAMLVTVAKRAGLIVSAQVSARSMRVRVSDVTQEALTERRMPLPTDHSIDTVLDRVALLVSEMISQIGSQPEELLGIGLGVPGPVDPTSGMISVAGALRGWEDQPIAEILRRRLGCPVTVDKAANFAVLAESTVGATRGLADSLYVQASHTAVAGVMIASRIHRGYRGTAGEIGHIVVRPGGPLCACGRRGCLDAVAGASALLAAVRDDRPTLTLRDVVAQAIAGDVLCVDAITVAGEAYGTAIASTYQSLNPQAIVLGGELVGAGTIFTQPLREAVLAHTNRGTADPIAIEMSQLGGSAELIGATISVLQSTDISARVPERA